MPSSPPKNTKRSKTHKRRLGQKGHSYTRRMSKVGGNKTKLESPLKLEIRIDKYKPDSSDDTTHVKQKSLGFTRNDTGDDILRKVNVVNLQNSLIQRGVSNNRFKKGNEHIIEEERAMMKDERKKAVKKEKSTSRR